MLVDTDGILGMHRQNEAKETKTVKAICQTPQKMEEPEHKKGTFLIR
jgi:hypothetical protein